MLVINCVFKSVYRGRGLVVSGCLATSILRFESCCNNKPKLWTYHCGGCWLVIGDALIGTMFREWAGAKSGWNPVQKLTEKVVFSPSFSCPQGVWLLNNLGVLPKQSVSGKTIGHRTIIKYAHSLHYSQIWSMPFSTKQKMPMHTHRELNIVTYILWPLQTNQGVWFQDRNLLYEWWGKCSSRIGLIETCTHNLKVLTAN